MTQQELNVILDTSFTIPVLVRNETFPNNIPYQQLNNITNNGFSFTARELLHAIGSKTASLPTSNLDECVNAAYLYSHLLDFQGQNLGFKTTVNIDSDLQTNRSNEIGIGVGCLLANKLFNVDWDTLESIKGQGKRFDYRATNLGQNYAYEFKGTKHRRKQNKQVENGIAKKTEMHQRNENYDVELIISTYLGFSNQIPRIVLADPPFQGFKNEFTEDADMLYRLRHLSRIAQFMGNTPLSRVYYNQSKEFIVKRDITQIQGDVERLIRAEIPEIGNQLYIGKIATENIENRNFIGRWVSYWQPESKRLKRKSFELPKFSENEEIEIFQGVESALYQSMTENKIYNLKEKLRFEKQNLKSNSGVEYTKFSDGTIMGIRLKSQ
jgi:hypothetical protein